MKAHVYVHIYACARSTSGRVNYFVRGVTIYEFIRDCICTWQPELLVIKTCVLLSIRILRFHEKEDSGCEKGFQITVIFVVVAIMYAERAIQARAALSPFLPKHVVKHV